jgi:protein-tyrosine phosphatase
VLQSINNRYGTHRGLIRLLLDTLKWKLGRYDQYQQVDWSKVRRLVFVCQGNICRSPYGHVLAQTTLPDNVVSMGYATAGTGTPANEVARCVAADRGSSLERHRATDMSDFDVMDGDLFLVMEDRHIARIEAFVSGKDTQIALLGLFATPRQPLIYDPHNLSAAYFHSCYAVIESAVDGVVRQYLQSRA